MLIWLLAALLAGLTLFALVAGSARLARKAAVPDHAAHLEVYKDQLAEIEREVQRGVINPSEAEAQRTETARRLLAASRERASATAVPSKTQGWLAALMVPALAFVLYGAYGSPHLPAVPQAERLAAAETSGDLEALVYKVETHLAKNPDDAKGWELLVPVYKSLNRRDKAADAYRNLIRVGGPTADLQAGLAEELTLANLGMMTPEAASAARAAVSIDGQNPKARYFFALSLTQEGKLDEGLLQYRALLADSATDAPWRASVEARIADLEKQKSSAPALTQEQAASVLAQPGDSQQAMIRGMVDGLAAKLVSDPNNLEGWLRLIRARTVLQEMPAARDALERARVVFSGNPAALQSLEALAGELGLT